MPFLVVRKRRIIGMRSRKQRWLLDKMASEIDAERKCLWCEVNSELAVLER